jgi:hypothetical protein
LKFLRFFERKSLVERLSFLGKVNRACQEIRRVLEQEARIIGVKCAEIKLEILFHFSLEFVRLEDPREFVVSAES